MKFLDLFAGIGGFRLGMEAAGHECVGYVEIDKYARKSYEAIHNTEGEWTAHDITEVPNEHLRLFRGRVDVICGGFPCQAFSVAGKRGGFSDTRGTLFFDVARFAEQIKPRFLFLENVKGLLSHDKGKTFATILNTFHDMGYDAEWQVLNSKNFGVPQNRERVFIIGHLRGQPRREILPFGENSREAVESQRRRGNTGTLLKGCSTRTRSYIGKPERLEVRKDDLSNAITSVAKDSMVIHGLPIREATAKGYDIAKPGDSVNYSVPTSKTRRGRVGKGVANTLDTGCQQGTVTSDLRIRKLTPRECFRLQGFPDWAFNKAQEVNSNSQLYKQAGNSVTVNVIEAIAKRL